MENTLLRINLGAQTRQIRNIVYQNKINELISNKHFIIR